MNIALREMIPTLSKKWIESTSHNPVQYQGTRGPIVSRLQVHRIQGAQSGSHRPKVPTARQNQGIAYADCPGSSTTPTSRSSRYIVGKERLIALLEEERQAVIHQAVTRGLDPNVRLKPSSVEWLGDVPEHWTIRRLKTLCGMRSGDGITTEAIEQDGKYPVYGGNGLRGYATDFTHDGSYALIGRQGALCGNVHAVQGRFWASEHAVVASLQSENKMHWFVALLEAMNLNQYSVAAAQPGLAVERIMNLWAPVPPPQEQSRIGKHIARLTSGLTDATERARRQIELIEEYRTRLIADVVTGKIDVREESVQSLTAAVQYP